MPTVSLDAIYWNNSDLSYETGEVQVGLRDDTLYYINSYDVFTGIYEAVFDFIPTFVEFNGQHLSSYADFEHLTQAVVNVEWGPLSTTTLVMADTDGNLVAYAPVAGLDVVQIAALGDAALDEIYSTYTMERYLAGDEQFGPGQVFDASDLASDLTGYTHAGTNGRNRIAGTSGDDVMFGLGGRDVLRGRGGDDALFGGSGTDRVVAGSGDDFLSGFDGRDRLFGGRGNDMIDGGDGNDRLSGAGGRDVLMGRAGNDRLVGGAGADEFVFNADEDGRDVVRDFGRGNDTLTFYQVDNLTDTQFLDQYVSVIDRGVWISFGGRDGVLLLGVDDVSELRGHIEII